MDNNMNNHQLAHNTTTDNININSTQLSTISDNQSIIKINNSNKRKHPYQLVNIVTEDDNNNKFKRIIQPNASNNNKNCITIDGNSILVGNILYMCLSHLQLEELNAIINRINKYWRKAIYNRITLQNIEFKLDVKRQELLLTNILCSNNNGTSLLNQLKYASNILLEELKLAELLIYILKHNNNLKKLSLHYSHDFDRLAENGELLGSGTLYNLQSLSIFHTETIYKSVLYPLLIQFMKSMDLTKITDLTLGKSRNLWQLPQIFETNPFPNLSKLFLQVDSKGSMFIQANLQHLSNLTQLIDLEVHFGWFMDINIDWVWLSKLVNLERIALKWLDILPLSLTGCIQVLTTLPRLTQLDIPVRALSSQLFLEQAANLKKLSRIDTFLYNLPLTTFPTIPTLTHLSLWFRGDLFGSKEINVFQSIFPVLISNPQMHRIEWNSLAVVGVSDMISMLQITPNLLQYSLCTDNQIKCCERYPRPLVNVLSSFSEFITNTSRNELIARLKQHQKQDYICPNPICHKT